MADSKNPKKIVVKREIANLEKFLEELDRVEEGKQLKALRENLAQN